MKIRDISRAIVDMENPARSVLFICAAVAAILIVGSALIWAGVHVYALTLERLQVHRVVEITEFWVVRTKPVQVFGSQLVDAGPFNNRPTCEDYATLMTRYSHYATTARQYLVVLRASWGPEVETVEACAALRQGELPSLQTPDFPLGFSLEEAQKYLRDSLTIMRSCRDDWARYDGVPDSVPNPGGRFPG
jgi:hypothetical protein